jgi:hypothetical protein
MVKGKTRGRIHKGKRSVKLGYLPCEIGDGMFGGEKIVSVRVNDQDISVIVNSESLSGDKLKVEIIGRRGSQFLIGFPGESFSARQVWIPEGSLALKLNT